MINLPRCPIELRHRIDSHYGKKDGKKEDTHDFSEAN